MGLYIQLHLYGLMLISQVFSFSASAHPVLNRVLATLGFPSEEETSAERIRTSFYAVIQALDKQLSYYDSSELKVNWLIDDYLKNLYYRMMRGEFETPKTVAMCICGMGNKGGSMDQHHGTELFLDEAAATLGKLVMYYEGKQPLTVEDLQQCIQRLEFSEKVLELTDVFVTSRLGAMLGAPEYSPAQLEDVGEIPDPDFDIDGLACSGSTDCLCGCTMDHPLKVIQGMEDFLNGVESSARDYFVGVAGANNIRLEGYTGNEGPVFDAIKDVGEKAWNALSASLKAIKEMFSSSDSSAKVEAAEEAADNNKKALAAMKDTAAVINDKARQGIQTLADTIDPTGKIKNLVSQLRTPKDAPKVIDALMGLMAKEATNNGSVGKQLDTAATSISDLKSATAAASGDESNKDVVAAKKSKVNDKVKASKEAIKDVKFELAAHSKLMDGIKKAITGISPKIFIVDKSKDEGNKDE